MSTWARGYVEIDPYNPSARACCDRCGAWWNRYALRYEYQWAGFNLVSKGSLMCPKCLNEPSLFLKARILPPDPPPIDQPRPMSAVAAMTDYRITEAGDTRITESEDPRIIDADDFDPSYGA